MMSQAYTVQLDTHTDDYIDVEPLLDDDLTAVICKRLGVERDELNTYDYESDIDKTVVFVGYNETISRNDISVKVTAVYDFAGIIVRGETVVSELYDNIEAVELATGCIVHPYERASEVFEQWCLTR